MPFASREKRVQYLKEYHKRNRAAQLASMKLRYRGNKAAKLAADKRWRDANKTKISERRRLARIRDKDKIKERGRRYWLKNRSRLTHKNKKYREKNRIFLLAKAKERARKTKDHRCKLYKAYYLKRKEAVQAWQKLYRRENPDVFRRASAKRKATLLMRFHPLCDLKKVAEHFRVAQKLTICTGVIHHVDHIIPLAAGGWHHHDNLSPLPAALNLSKKNDPFWLSPSTDYKDWRSVPELLWPLQLAQEYARRLNLNHHENTSSSNSQLSA